MAGEWRAEAACKGADTSLFYPVDGAKDITDADPNGVVERFCSTCPVRELCLEDARGEPLGIWGGLTPEQRARMKP